MADFYATAPGWSFSGLRFPAKWWKISSELRNHVHEYPHAPGGALEKLGRKVVRISVKAMFHNTFALYPDLYPKGAQLIQALHDDATTASLVVPNLGTLQMCMVKLDRESDMQHGRSGEAIEMDFLEDESNEFTLAGITATSSTALVPSAAQVQSDLAAVQGQIRAVSTSSSPQQQQIADLSQQRYVAGLVTALQGAVQSFLAIGDTASLYGQSVALSLQTVVGLCQKLDAVPSIHDPAFAALLDSIHALWAQAQNALNDLLSTGNKVAIFVVPTVMAIQTISTRLYGDATHALQLLQLNEINDAFRVPAGTELLYYPAAA